MRGYIMKRYFYALLFLVTLFAPLAAAEDLKVVYTEAQRNFRHGNYESAIERWTRILESQPTDTNVEAIETADVYFNRGISYKKLQVWDKAADDFSMAIAFSYNDAEAYYQRSGCYAMMGLADKAQADINRACELSDDYCSEKQLEEKKKHK
jgi:tetratricopeptide (TPR) repeat protein